MRVDDERRGRVAGVTSVIIAINASTSSQTNKHSVSFSFSSRKEKYRSGRTFFFEVTLFLMSYSRFNVAPRCALDTEAISALKCVFRGLLYNQLVEMCHALSEGRRNWIWSFDRKHQVVTLTIYCDMDTRSIRWGIISCWRTVEYRTDVDNLKVATRSTKCTGYQDVEKTLGGH